MNAHDNLWQDCQTVGISPMIIGLTGYLTWLSSLPHISVGLPVQD